MTVLDGDRNPDCPPTEGKTMFEIRICGIGESVYFMNQYTKVIGIVNPDANVTPTEKYHIERCHDIREELSPWIKPQKEQFQRILEFSKDFTSDDKVLVHCSAGISRSTAVGIMISIQHGLTEDEAFKKVYAVRPHMYPNSLILEYADELLGRDGKLLEYFIDWCKNKKADPVNFAGQKNTNSVGIDAMKDILKKLQ